MGPTTAAATATTTATATATATVRHMTTAPLGLPGAVMFHKRRTRLKACLNIDRHYGSLGPGGLPPSLRRRHKTSTQRSHFLLDGTPVTPQGAMQTFGRAGLPNADESRELQLWKEGGVPLAMWFHSLGFR